MFISIHFHRWNSIIFVIRIHWCLRWRLVTFILLYFMDIQLDDGNNNKILKKTDSFMHFIFNSNAMTTNNRTFILIIRSITILTVNEVNVCTYGIVRKSFDTRQHHPMYNQMCLSWRCKRIEYGPSREIHLFRSFKHTNTNTNIIRLYDIQVHQPTGELCLFYELMKLDKRNSCPMIYQKVIWNKFGSALMMFTQNSMWHRVI
jgi:hypothetical protein